MFSNFKETKQLLGEIKNVKKVKCDEEGYAEVNINVSNDDGFLSVFSPDENPVISTETAEYIEHSIKHIHPDTDLHFHFSSGKIDETERIIYEKAIRNYYHSEFIEISRDLHRNTVQTHIMVIIAAAVFACAVILESIEAKPVILNMLDVVAWVFMWEAVDAFAFGRYSLKIKRIRFSKIIKSKITFSE